MRIYYLQSQPEGGGVVRSLYIDFSKALNRVNRTFLLHKLGQLGWWVLYKPRDIAINYV